MYREIYDALDKNGRVKTAVILDGPLAGEKCLVENGVCKGKTDWSRFQDAVAACGDTKLLEADGTSVFVEVYEKEPRLILCGGGHVSQPVAQIAKLLGFRVTVMDDRAEFVTPERFPDADELVVGSFDEIDEKIPVYENAYYVVVTRGHQGDTICARQILRRPYTYFGMIGSKNKVRTARENLLAEGFTEEALDTVHSPIGIPLGGQTPAEIAVSIMAEIVQVKNRCQVSYADDKVEEGVKQSKKGVMLTIVKKHGSSPRGAGSKMFIDENGKCFGSIGGGNVEYQASKYAAEVKKMELARYNLSKEDVAGLGMVCGGNVEVLFEPVDVDV